LFADASLIWTLKHFLVLFVNESEYSRSTGAKPILSLSSIYLVPPGALLLLLRQLRIFAAAAARVHELSA
jgi:hypothetical protein